MKLLEKLRNYLNLPLNQPMLALVQRVKSSEVIVDNKKLFGMANIGYRPTIRMQKHELTAEVNIFNFSQDIYKKGISILFIDKIREEQKFDSIEALKEQLAEDKKFCFLAIQNLT